MSADVLKFPVERCVSEAPTFTDPRLQRLAEVFASAVDKKTGKPIGAQAGIEVTRSFLELVEQHRVGKL